MVLVVISAIIVATYIGLQLVIRAPEIPQTEPDTPPSSSSQIGQPSAPPEDPNALVRKEGVYTFALLGKDVKGSNTDTIILARYDTVAQTVGMVSIPRDTAVHRTWSKYSKINAAFYGSSPETLKEEIQNTFGIPVDYYILVDPKGFTALVDELGGVDVYIPENMNYDDPTPGEELHIHYQAGTHHLNGKQALEVARFRHNNDGSGYTDTGRAEMHRQMLVALAKKVVCLCGALPNLRQDRPVRLGYALFRHSGHGGGFLLRHHPGGTHRPGRRRGRQFQVVLCIPAGGHPPHAERAAQPVYPGPHSRRPGSAPARPLSSKLLISQGRPRSGRPIFIFSTDPA